ncbi:MAG: DUF4139 domain-containing protein, partial [Tepidisphaeraceae bacterium]
MRNLLRSAVLALAISAVSFPCLAADAPKADAGQADVPVKAVVLFSSGVGYFEHVGQVKGNSSTELRFKTNQINDILKSLVLQDMGGGKVTTIVYPSQDPVDKLLKSFQVDITSNPTLPELLNQLRGAKVKVTAGTESLAGTILGLEKKPKAVDKATIEIWAMNLLAGDTIRTVNMDDVAKLELEDAQLGEELNRALSALAQARDQDKKTVTINFQGDGERIVRLGYVVETPIWKTSYRLLLSPEKDKHQLQGWAIVENQTDNDWNDVQLSLVSGRPISFIQELYQPLYIPRPVVQPELYASLRPQTYDAGIAQRKAIELAVADEDSFGLANAAGEQRAKRARSLGGKGEAAARGDDKPQQQLQQQLARQDRLYDGAVEKPMDAAASVASVASASKVGELFQYTVGNVSLPRQRSAMIPIITDPIEVERLSIYNAAVLARNPLNGARVKNTTRKHLLQGPITVLDGATYAGDARIDNVPPNQERLLSYGIDLQMLVNSTKNKNESSLLTGKIVKGVLQLQRKIVFTQEYEADNKAETDKTLIIEHPLRQNWKLVQPEKALETTDRLYRFKTIVPAGKTGAFTVKEEIVQGEQFQLLSADVGTMELYSKAGEIPQPVKDALITAAKMRQKLVEIQRGIDKSKGEIAAITQDQTRIRENIKSLPDKSALRTRLMEKLDQQETQLDTLLKGIDQGQKDLEKSRKELEDYL